MELTTEQARRDKLALTIRELAKRAGVSFRVVWKWEHNESISPESAERIERALQARAKELIEIGTGEIVSTSAA